jgi:tetratricopeptide (TPR) repeat protein
MYYSYKSKKKNKKIFKIILLILIVSGIFYLGAKYHQYLFFWKYTYNKISIELDEISKIDDIEKKKLKLQEISEICTDYNNANQISADTFFLTGKIHFQLGEVYLNKTFSEFIMSNCFGCVTQKASSEFLNAIKYIRKGMALKGSNDADPEYLIILAKSCFYNNYYTVKDTYKIIEKVTNVESLSNIDDIRFLSIINILNKKEEYGLELLNKYGMTDGDSIKGRFFLASAYSIAGKYTDSIISFKHILNNCSDNNLIKLANINLGKIYFNQSLYKESLVHFSNALRIDDRDNFLKIWIGKNYSALGEKGKAKAIWNEVLASDQTNKEARKLLGLM